MILFIGATLKELQHFTRSAVGAGLQYQAGEVVQYKGHDVCLLPCGVGPLNAALGLQSFLLLHPGVDVVVNVGIAGSYDLNNLPLGAVCMAQAEIWPEYGVRSSSAWVDPWALGFPLQGEGESEIWNRIELGAPGAVNYTRALCLDPGRDCEYATSLTLAGVSGNRELALELSRRYQAGMENMEGFALALVCRMQNIPFVEIRTISNLAGSRDSRDWDFKAAFQALSRVWTRLWQEE